MQEINKFIVTGVAGKIGSSFVKDKRVESFVGVYHEEEPTNLKKGKYFQTDLAIDINIPEKYQKDFPVVVHTAAKTHIDKCEADRKNGEKGEVWRSNVVATQNVINFCSKYKKKLVYLSTECVFDGEKEIFKEGDKKNPINWYGETKSEAENLVVNSGLDFLIIRGVVAYGREKRLDDIVQLIYNKLKIDGELKVVDDQRMNPTLVQDIVDSIFSLTSERVNGIYHVAGSTIATPLEIAKKIAKFLHIDKGKITPLSMKKYFGAEKARLRLKNSVLNITKYENETGITTTRLDEGLKIVFESNTNL